MILIEIQFIILLDLNTGSTVCKVCGQIMIPGFTSKVRIKRAKKYV